MQHGTIVGIIRGGPSPDHAESLLSGQALLTKLPAELYALRDIYIDQSGVWHERGRVTTPDRVLPSLDVAVIATTGTYGASGAIQRLLEQYGVPYTGSRALPSFTATHGVLSRTHASEQGLNTPRFRHVDDASKVHEEVQEATRSYLPPVIVRPAASQSHSTTVLTGYQPIHQAVTGILAAGQGGALIEERLQGRYAQVHVLEGIRGEERYVLPPQQLSGISSSDALPFTRQEQQELVAAARKMHDALSLRHHSSSLFVLTAKGLYYLATDPFPHMGANSALATSCASVGISPEELFTQLVNLALLERKR